jgi:nucleotide-binding universal stress UspA family protein
VSEGRTGDQEALTIHRILVAIDASRDSRAALRAAVQMASRFHAELEGLYVEDLNILRAARIPFAQEFGHYTGDRRLISPLAIERDMRARIRRMRHLFHALTAEKSVAGSFHVARGMVHSEIRSAAAEADVLIIGRMGWASTHVERMGEPVESACADTAPRVTAVLREGAVLAPPVVVVYDGSDLSGKVLRVGAALVDEMSGPLQILLLPVPGETTASLRTQANACLRPTSVMRQYRMLTSSRLPWLIHALRDTAAGTLVLPGDAEVLQEGRMSDLLSTINIPVLLVR